jgi:hypothetical protein
MSLAPMPMAVPKEKMTVSAKIHVYSAGAGSCDSSACCDVLQLGFCVCVDDRQQGLRDDRTLMPALQLLVVQPRGWCVGPRTTQGADSVMTNAHDY